MIAHRHGVIAQAIHNLGCGLALIVCVEQGALKLITGIEQQHIAVRSADRRYGPGQPRGAAPAFIFGYMFRRANRAKWWRGSEASMHIIGVQNGKVEAAGERRCARREKKSCNGNSPSSRHSPSTFSRDSAPYPRQIKCAKNREFPGRPPLWPPFPPQRRALPPACR